MRFFRPLILILFAALALSACGTSAAPPVASAPTELPPAAELAVTVTPLPRTDTPAPAPTETVAGPVPQATSRGAELEASDPALVALGAGRPVLVEFFRFT